MKYIKTYELSFPFFKRKKQKEEIEEIVPVHEPYAEIPVDSSGEYIYNNIKYKLKIGDRLNLGIIKNIKYEKHTVVYGRTTFDQYDEIVMWIITDEYKFKIYNPPEKIYIIKGDEASIAANKYNL